MKKKYLYENLRKNMVVCRGGDMIQYYRIAEAFRFAAGNFVLFWKR